MSLVTKHRLRFTTLRIFLSAQTDVSRITMIYKLYGILRKRGLFELAARIRISIYLLASQHPSFFLLFFLFFFNNCSFSFLSLFIYLFIYLFFYKKNTFDSRYEHERICYITRKILMIEMMIAEQRNKQQN